jgi:hypothetical protein
MNNLNSDIVVLMTNNLDLIDIVSLSQISKKLNKDIIQNNNFWMYRLKKDYNIDYTSGNPKQIYQRIHKIIPHSGKSKIIIDKVLTNAAGDGDLDLVKAAIYKGGELRTLVSAVYGSLEVFKYLLSIRKTPLTQSEASKLLYYAVGSYNLDIVKYLVEELGARDRDGQYKRKVIDEGEYILKELSDDKRSERYLQQKRIIEYLKHNI